MAKFNIIWGRLWIDTIRLEGRLDINIDINEEIAELKQVLLKLSRKVGDIIPPVPKDEPQYRGTRSRDLSLQEKEPGKDMEQDSSYEQYINGSEEYRDAIDTLHAFMKNKVSWNNVIESWNLCTPQEQGWIAEIWNKELKKRYPPDVLETS